MALGKWYYSSGKQINGQLGWQNGKPGMENGRKEDIEQDKSET